MGLSGDVIWSLIFVLNSLLQPVQCFWPVVNGVEFYEMSTYFTEVEDRVFFMQMDRYKANFLLYADGSALKTLDLKLRKSYTIAGVSRNRNGTYADGVGPSARFRLITSFEQLDRETVLITDHHNHCIRVVYRSTNATATYAGRCTERGTADGTLSEARFSQPDEVATSSDPNVIYICDGKAIRELNVRRKIVSTFISVGYTPISLVIDDTKKNIYVSTSTRILKINLKTKEFTYLSRSTTPGFRDGPLPMALFRTMLNFIFLNPQTILGVDSRNNRLRVLNLEGNNVTSICNGGNISKDGDAHLCQIFQPFSLITVPNESRVLIGGTGRIRSLSVAGLPRMTPSHVTTTGPAAPVTTIAVAVTIPLVLVAILIVIVSIWVCRTKAACCFSGKVEKISMPTSVTSPLPSTPERYDDGDTYEELRVTSYVSVDESDSTNRNCPPAQVEYSYVELPERKDDVDAIRPCEVDGGYIDDAWIAYASTHPV